MSGFISRIETTMSLVSKYLLSGWSLKSDGQRLHDIADRKDSSYKVISNVNLYFVCDEDNLTALNLHNNDVVVVDDYVIKIYDKEDKCLQEIDEETLIVTKNNDLFFYDQIEGKLIYLSSATTTLDKYAVIRNYRIFQLLNQKKIKPNKKYQEMIYNKLKEKGVDIGQLDPKMIEHFSDYIAASSYTPIIFSMLLTIVLYVIAVVAVAAGIALLFSGALVFAIMVAVTAPIASGVAAITSCIAALKEGSKLLMWGAVFFAALAIGSLLIALAVVCPGVAIGLGTIGIILVVAGTVGAGLVFAIKSIPTIKSYYKKLSNYIKNDLISSLKKLAPSQHLRNIFYLGVVAAVILGVVGIICAFVFLPCAFICFGVMGFVTASAIGCLVASLIIDNKEKVINFFKRQKNKVVNWAKNTGVADHLRNAAYAGAFVTTGLFVTAVVCAFVFLPAVPFLLTAGTIAAVATAGIWTVSKVIKCKNKIVNAYQQTKEFIAQKAVPTATNAITNTFNAVINFPKKIVNGVKAIGLLLKGRRAADMRINCRADETHDIKIHNIKVKKQKPVKTSMIKAMMHNSMLTSMVSCPMLNAFIHHAHRSLHAATMLTVTAVVFGVFTGGRKFFHTSKRAKKNKVAVCEKNKLVSICNTKSQVLEQQSSEIKISEVDLPVSSQLQTCRKNADITNDTVANNAAELIKP